jgi:acyl-coenzyme A thioesterase PaaI-like protein
MSSDIVEERNKHPVVDPWRPEGEPSKRRQTKHQLVAGMRRTIESVTLIDPEGTSDDLFDSLLAASAELESLIDLAPSFRARGGSHHGRPQDRPLIERGLISGLSNPLAPPLSMEVWSGEPVVRASAVFSSAYEGPDGMVHGGMILASFDEVLAMAQLPSGEISVTGTVTVRLMAPMPLGQRIEFEGGVSSVEERKILTWGRATLDGVTLAEGTAICVRRREGSGDAPSS